MTHRPLTAGEVALAKTVFKDSIDYSRVRLYDARLFPNFIQAKNRAMADLNRVSFPGSAYSDDFSTDPDLIRRSIFIHELAHVWQHQNGVINTRKAFVNEMVRHKFKYAASYRYALDAAKDLKDYGLEQQATIIQDYFLLQNGSSHSHRASRSNAETGADLMKIYDSVLEKFNADPSYAGRKKRGRKPPKPR